METQPSKRVVTFTFSEASSATAAEFVAPAMLPIVAGTRIETDLPAMKSSRTQRNERPRHSDRSRHRLAHASEYKRRCGRVKFEFFMASIEAAYPVYSRCRRPAYGRW